MSAQNRLDGVRVLVVDDSRDTADMLAHAFRFVGAAAETAESGAEALTLAAAHSFDVIVSDLSMPIMDGFELLRQLRALPNCPHVPVVALTGIARADDLERAKREGFAAQLAKPIELDALISAVQSVLSKPGE
jgi:two-component system CheB/CheR fusion protein